MLIAIRQICSGWPFSSGGCWVLHHALARGGPILGRKVSVAGDHGYGLVVGQRLDGFERDPHLGKPAAEGMPTADSTCALLILCGNESLRCALIGDEHINQPASQGSQDGRRLAASSGDANDPLAFAERVQIDSHDPLHQR